MAGKSIPKISCPICNKPDTWTSENKFRPFCSERCKLIDLGEWAGEDRLIPGENINPENLDPDNNEE